MPELYIIAGPPGIGKSTNGSLFIPQDIEVLNHDKLSIFYRNQSEFNYEDLSNIKANQFIQDNLLKSKSFGIEINLGFENHYDLIRYVKQKHSDYLIKVVMFYSDSLQLCIDRAKYREINGGHSVKVEVIIEMYEKTLLLLKRNAKWIDGIRFVDIIASQFVPEIVYSLRFVNDVDEYFGISLPQWFINNFENIVERKH